MRIFLYLFIGVVLIVVVGALVAFWPRPAVHVYDGFESGELSAYWMRLRFARGAVRMQSQVKRRGNSAAEITVRSGDRREEATADGPATERDELMESWQYFSRLHRDYRYSFSLYLPAGFPIVPTRVVLAQWKQLCEWGGCFKNNPVLAVRYQNGKLAITRRDERGKTVLYSTDQELRGQWLDFRFETRFSPGQDGQIDAWLNGERIVQYRGSTVYPASLGYPAYGFVYFKTGLYRDEMQQPMTLYVDEYRKDELSR